MFALHAVHANKPNQHKQSALLVITLQIKAWLKETELITVDRSV